jgi:hypothetical protein
MSFKVERIEAEKFSKVWNKGGISIILSPEAIDFATDFGNIVLNNFIQVCQEQVKAAQKAAEPKKLIIEGL